MCSDPKCGYYPVSAKSNEVYAVDLIVELGSDITCPKSEKSSIPE
jgi:hypothetical protein